MKSVIAGKKVKKKDAEDVLRRTIDKGKYKKIF